MNTGEVTFSRGVTIAPTLHVQNEEACQLYRVAIVKIDYKGVFSLVHREKIILYTAFFLIFF